MKTLLEFCNSRATGRTLFVMLQLLEQEPRYISNVARDFNRDSRAVWYLLNQNAGYFEYVELPPQHNTGKTHGKPSTAGIRLTDKGREVASKILSELSALSFEIDY